MKADKYLLFRIGDIALATASSGVMSIHETVSVGPVPNTAHWFCGLAVIKGKLLPITDMGKFLVGKEACGHVLEVHPSLGIAGLRVDQVDGFTETIAEIHDVDLAFKALPEAIGLSRFAVSYSSVWYQVLELPVLLNCGRFVDIAAETT
ncbi:MAG: chemotaxis protein CheW [Gammaproteobacteria bacterium]|nr:chemotaxis protein CheW [Gammaproteobacteria bacterium]